MWIISTGGSIPHCYSETHNLAEEDEYIFTSLLRTYISSAINQRGSEDKAPFCNKGLSAHVWGFSFSNIPSVLVVSCV